MSLDDYIRKILDQPLLHEDIELLFEFLLTYYTHEDSTVAK